MKLSAAFLCDYASVREGLLHVLGGGITRLWRESYPAPVNMSLAAVIELHKQDLDHPHELEIIVMGEDGQTVAEIKGGFQVAASPDLEVGETQLLPLPLDLRPGAIPAPGPYTVSIAIDGEHRGSLRFSARLAAERQAQIPPPSN